MNNAVNEDGDHLFEFVNNFPWIGFKIDPDAPSNWWLLMGDAYSFNLGQSLLPSTSHDCKWISYTVSKSQLSHLIKINCWAVIFHIGHLERKHLGLGISFTIFQFHVGNKPQTYAHSFIYFPFRTISNCRVIYFHRKSKTILCCSLSRFSYYYKLYVCVFGSKRNDIHFTMHAISIVFTYIYILF